MYEAFCRDVGLAEPVWRAMEQAPKDCALFARAKIAVAGRDQESFKTVCQEGMQRYGAVFTLLALAECYPVTKRYYPDPEVRHATLSDIAIWVRHYEQRAGAIGADNVSWLCHHACGSIIRLGRLQYEEAPFPFAVTIFRDREGRFSLSGGEGMDVVLKGGMPCLRLHIPEGEPLDEREVDDSLAWAARWFSRFPIVVCDSWLLDPALSQVLSPDSRIIRFQKRFTLFPVPQHGLPQIYERVFGFGLCEQDVLSFPSATTLQKRVQEALGKGIRFHSWGGFLALRA
ncbi:MAG: acyltransferase domain-containing protein [Sphaerochaetaceae bacterium]|nr:acyltransferase domain-containing protein [Spirochaetales bacterium]MDY5500321.1 acyltransferase domain-containing protein [Sphaerochaetaceae bacterium]